ncbi:MAG: hypothetical protein ACI814_001510 [Mariniblastus sp.]
MSYPLSHRIVVPFSLLVLAFNGYLKAATFQGIDATARKVDFALQIKPLLSDRCFLCHGPDEGTRKADLRLDHEDGVSAVVEAGKPDDSDLVYRIFSDDEGEVMPPPDSNLSLTADEKELLKRWVAEGANWQQHWAFIKPEKTALPSLKHQDWAANEIDQFVLKQLESKQLAPGKPASKAKLIRRATFDLTGLPPTLQELDAALEDPSGRWYENVIDRLLASQRYGERMTADWLDVARYSDTYGYQVDRDRFVWPWRDWVVGSFNQNMPYDQFMTEQLAGDLLPDATDEQILATTFNRLHPQKVEGGSVEEEFRVEYVADRSQTVGMAFMGLTVECARCHDHKYDPISQKEYYELFAFFNNVDESGLYSYFDASAIPTPTLMMADENQKSKLTGLEKGIQALEQKRHLAWISLSLKLPPVSGTLKATPNPFTDWLNDLDARKKLATAAIDGESFAIDFGKVKNANNKLAKDSAGQAVLTMTGDDEVKLEAGDFRRHQPFTIATRIKVPQDAAVLKRAVIFHRSRAWTDSASRGYQLLIEDGRLSASLIHFWPGDAISVKTIEPIATEAWQDVTVVYDGSSRADGLKIFVNGKLAAVEIVRDNLQKTIKGSGTDRLILGARFRDNGFKNGQIADVKVFDRQLSGFEVARMTDEAQYANVLNRAREDLSAAEVNTLLEFFVLTDKDQFADMHRSMAAQRKTLNDLRDGIQEIMVMREMETPRPAFVLDRGAYDSPTVPVTAATPAAFPQIPAGSSNNRLGLAKWLSDPSHPLTARVAVNHYWQLCFGAGLVRTPEDFGSQGQPPTHPQLLDWLAVDFQEHGWDVKRLLKQIVMSRTYRQTTSASAELLQTDPENRLLGRAPTYRLPAEMIRDNVLFSSGLLVEKIGGPPVRPYELAHSFQPSTPDKGSGLYRRSLYTYWKRTGPAPVMLTLDAAKRDVCQVKRERTSSPLAALVQLNNPQSVEAARKLAERLMSAHGDNPKLMATQMFRTLTSRFPTAKESEILDSLYQSQLNYFTDDESAATSFLAIGATPSETETPSELAAWAAVANTLFSFDECVMKR